jgi:hypothetical protein
VDAVGADNHVERLGRAMIEGGINARVGLGQGGDRVTEDVGDPIPAGPVQNLAEHAPGNFHVAASRVVGKPADI